MRVNADPKRWTTADGGSIVEAYLIYQLQPELAFRQGQVELLLKRGADPAVHDAENVTALMPAQKYGRK